MSKNPLRAILAVTTAILGALLILQALKDGSGKAATGKAAGLFRTPLKIQTHVAQSTTFVCESQAARGPASVYPQNISNTTVLDSISLAQLKDHSRTRLRKHDDLLLGGQPLVDNPQRIQFMDKVGQIRAEGSEWKGSANIDTAAGSFAVTLLIQFEASFGDFSDKASCVLGVIQLKGADKTEHSHIQICNENFISWNGDRVYQPIDYGTFSEILSGVTFSLPTITPSVLVAFDPNVDQLLETTLTWQKIEAEQYYALSDEINPPIKLEEKVPDPADLFQIARRTYVEGRYQECIDTLSQLHRLVPEYENSHELASFCIDGMELVIQEYNLDRNTGR